MSKKSSPGATPTTVSNVSLPVPLTPRAGSPTGSTASSLANSVATAPEYRNGSNDAEKEPQSAVSTTAPSLQIPTRGLNRRIQSRSPSRPRTASFNPDDPYPTFLLQSKNDLAEKFMELYFTNQETTDKHAEDIANTQPYGEAYPEVALRNRYTNIEAWHHNRIILRNTTEGQSDYINASPITLKRTTDSTLDPEESYYIASQGPKDNTVGHFWHMLWQESASPIILIMLTKTYEIQREKCYEYTPSTSDILIDSNGVVLAEAEYRITPGTCTERDELGCTYREFIIRSEKTNEEKTVHHYAFRNWPDHSMPEGEDRTKLLALIQETHELAKEHKTSPRIVHCSAGVGRTGTFMALDYLLALLKKGRLRKGAVGEEDVILSVVKDLRRQRMLMVQSQQQYLLLYEILRGEMEKAWEEGVVPKEE